MKKRFVIITLSLCMLLAAPAQSFAACGSSGAAGGSQLPCNAVFKVMNLKGDCSFNKLFSNYSNSCLEKLKAQFTQAQNGSCTGGNQNCANGNNCTDSNQNCVTNGNSCTGDNQNCVTNGSCGSNQTKPDNQGNQDSSTGNNSGNNQGNSTGNNSGNSDSNANQGNGNAGNTQDNQAAVGSYEQQVAALVNQERKAAGLSELKLNAKLSQVAEKKAEDMRDNNYFSHTSPTYGSPFEMMKQFGITYTSAGENIAKGQKTPSAVMNAWMNSAGHRANILNSSYDEIGVGYVTDAKGNTYWVQMFI